MIKYSQKQSGSTLAVVAIILVIATIGVLGLIFWQNFTNRTTNSTIQDTSDTKNAYPYKDWNNYESTNSKYSIKYPKNWIALKETVQDGPYIRNFDPASKQSQGGYPEGYINVRILREENNASFKTMTGYTTTEWYDALGKVQVRSGPMVHSPEDVKGMEISGLPAKSTKADFTETDEIIYVLRGDKLYSINLYPYGISSDPTVKLMLDSFTFTY
jgi:hypothetical protein